MRFSRKFKTALFGLTLILSPTLSLAQDTNVAFGGLKTDTTQPVQIDADQLTVNQEDGKATFTGNVTVSQGDMKMTAAEVVIEYSTDKKSVKSLHAGGGVTVAAGSDAATSESADYMPDSGDLILTGNVVLTQGPTALSGQKLTLSLKSGTGTMAGRVTTIFTPGQN